MKEFFRRLTLPAKLILIGVLPLTFLLIIVFQYNSEKNEKLQMIDGYRQRIEQAVNINDLIDQLQTERRYSFIYNLKGTSQNEMLEERRKTDEQIRNLQSETTSLPGFSTYTFLDRLNAYRARIDKKNLKPMEVMNFYTNAIFRLSTLNGVAAGNVIILQPIIKNISGQKILSDIITYQGIIVSHIFLMLETKESNPQLIASVIQLRDIINSYFTEFRIKAPKERIAEIDSLLNDPDRKTASLIEENIRSTNALDTIVSSGYLWDISTSAMDKLKMVQRSMMNEASEGADEIYNREKELQIWTFIGLILILIVVISFIVFTIRVITKSIADLKDAAQKIAEGQTGIQIKVDTNDAIGSLSQSIISIDKNNLKLAKAAKAIGEGNFNVPVEPRSKEDVLGNAIVQMKNDLQIFRRSNDEKLWLQNGIAAINNALRGDKTIEAICQDTLNTLVTYIKCESGLFYISKEHSLVFAAGYAVADNEAVPQEIEFGETLIGQVAKKKDHLHLKDVPDHFFQIRSGLGTSQPKEILLLSLHADDEIEGVIEVASLYNISEATINFLKEVSNDIAIALRSAKSKLRLQELFEQTQAQAEELQSQHSELENINAELEAQAEKLQASEEELKVQQEELLQVNAELEERSRLLEEKNQLIVERNIEIQQKAEELALSTKYKSEFLANMSHELRTPLNSVLLLSRLLSENNEQNLIPEQVEYARVIQSSGQGLLSLIDEILDLSKIEAGKMELEYSNVMLQEIVNDMKALFTPMAREKNIEFAISVDPKVPSQIETDKLRLEQILKNLLSNAVKFTKEGSVSLSISSLPENSTFISISVKDTGIGIQKEKQALIFEAFQQADGSTRRKFGGTGLGLSISRELTRLLGGEIKVTSEPGKGSEFTIYLPINKIDVKENSEVARELPAPETTAQKTNRAYRIETIPENLPDDRQEIQNDDKTILIIEDDTSFAKALLDYTHQKGYKGLVAVRGDEGIELARQYKPLGILLDIKLPVKDGWEVMEELKSNPKTRHIPVHIMSSIEAKRESLIKGAVDFINKPVAIEKMKEMFTKIEQVLSKDPKKVLIVEENAQHAKALAYFLESFDVSAQVAGTVEDSIDVLKKNEVDCVILDMSVPDQNAYETLETVKQKPGLENLPIIIFTGRSLSTTEESRIKQYADSIIVKTAHSYKRILDEVSLFLHLVEEGKKEPKPTKYKRLGALNEVLDGKKILIADDDVRNIFSLTKALEIHNMEVITAVDGKEALKRLEETADIDLVLMDIMMPEMDGYETMQEIRKKKKYKNLPIIAVTAKAMTGDREKCIKAGASDYISKPVDIDQLMSLLRVWLYDKSI